MPLAPGAGMVDRRRQELGIQGENLAVAALQADGYAILERRHRSRYGEIDIIAARHPLIVFVEVKLRTTDLFGEALEAIPPWKRRRIITVALDYLAHHDLLDRPVRFDVAAIDQHPGGLAVELIENAFDEDG